jgi:putative NADH-flavin reductase
MKIAIFGASGGTGIVTVFQALEKGHEVVAFARDEQKVPIKHDRLRIVTGDILDYPKVKQAVEGQDIVICTLGVNEKKKNTILSDGTRNIVKAMEECGVKRLICQSSSGIPSMTSGTPAKKVLIPSFLRQVFEDKKRQAEVIMKSSLEWVIVRPSTLTDSPKTKTYKITQDQPASKSVPRADVADFMLKLMTDHSYDGQMVAISS